MKTLLGPGGPSTMVPPMAAHLSLDERIEIERRVREAGPGDVIWIPAPRPWWKRAVAWVTRRAA